MKKLYSILLALVLLTSAAAASLFYQRTERTKVSALDQRTEKTKPSSPALGVDQAEIEVPIAEFNSTPEGDPKQREKRLLKNKRHNLRDKNLSAADRAEFILREKKPSKLGQPRRNATPPPGTLIPSPEYHPPVVGGAVTEESAPEPALPTYQSDAVIIASATQAKAYVSEDKTGVYSEFQLQISQVLKNTRSSDLDPAVPLQVLRPGGGVRFTSGAVKYFLVGGRGLPRIGSRYVLFLKYDDLAQSFYIITGYELRDDGVVPLDSIPPGGTAAHPFSQYAKYKGTNESSFLAEVSEAILHPNRPQRTGFPVGETSPNQEPKR